MCGIVAVLRAPSTRPVPDADALLDLLTRADTALAASPAEQTLLHAAAALGELDASLRGLPGVRALVEGKQLVKDIDARTERIAQRLAEIEGELDAAGSLAGADLERTNAALISLKDAAWAVRSDRLRTARAVAGLAGDARSADALGAYLSIQVALSSIDRLEVRGRDSAGVHVLVDNHGVDLDDEAVRREIAARNHELFTDGSVRAIDGRLGFVYKAAAEIGELGDNTAHLRATISADSLLRKAVSAPGAVATVLAHTRWASVGIISEPNAHPLNSEEGDSSRGPYVVAALNGDVDNHLELRAEERLEVAPEITTDAKVIPTLVSRRVAEGDDLLDAFRTTVARFEGSVAIATSSAADPEVLHLALRGSGQALYVGLAEDSFVIASEPYGLVEETPRYLRMDGEGIYGSNGVNGQVVEVRRDGAGTIAAIRRLAFDGTELPLSDDDISTAEITTRDIDRAGAPHFLLKEIGESPSSIRKTLRGKLVEDRGLLAARLPAAAMPGNLVDRLRRGDITRIIATGQGTAAIAARSVAASFTDALSSTAIDARAMTAAELSGFSLRDDMSDTLVVAVSQSGTSTDTNRTVDLVRARGATVVAIVNRRNSDLVDKSDGVLYTSDGRDVEMAVPSTKAFYAQVAAGILLAWGLADAAGLGDRHRGAELLDGLRRLPEAMETVLSRQGDIAEIAQRHAPPRRYWAIVGNGPNVVAAEEVRIKLSELCYKSVACDVTEDKKHIDLSSEPLILLCGAGLSGATADDVAKEVAIFRAHKAAPIVIANDGETRFDAALGVISVPAVHPELDFILSAMAGHLFGYEAAVAIDAQARLLREARGVIEESIAEHSDDVDLGRIGGQLAPLAESYFAELRNGALNGHLEADTAVRLSSLLRYALGTVPLEAYETEYGKVGSPAALIDDLLDALSDAIDELTRPIDAIKHQAKTVTVGISRSEDSFARSELVKEVLAAGAPRDRIGYKALRTLAELDPAVREVTGFSRCRCGHGDHLPRRRLRRRGDAAVAHRNRSRAEGHQAARRV
jgi:glutamine---fructose-6-phosphate transaminase (isomerizing)